MIRNLSVVLFLPVAALVAAFWWWSGVPVAMPADVATHPLRLPCVSYAPFRRGESPFDEAYVASPESIEADLVNLKAMTSCVRTYSVGQGLDRVPELAEKHGMKVLLGLWLGRDPVANAKEIALAIDTARKHPGVIRAVVVGNEVLLRRELTADTLGAIIRSVKLQVPTPVTYADVWEFWLRNTSLAAAVDFVTVHILPYWEDDPVGADKAIEHILDIRREVGEIFAGKDILIGETGWPSRGRMREAALPSPSNQAGVVQQLLAAAAGAGYDLNLIEAFDQPWKRVLEGTVGGHWGILDADTRQPKFGLGAAVSNHPHWRAQAFAGILFAGVIFGVAQHAARRGTWPLTLWDWLCVSAMAAVAGVALGAFAESARYEVMDAGSALRAAVLGLLVLAMPPIAASLRMRAIPPRPLGDLGPSRPGRRNARWFAYALAAAGAMGLFTALGFVFDARYRDFPIAAFLAIAAAALVAPRRGGVAQAMRAEQVFGWAIGLGAVGIVALEGIRNAQALALAAVLLILARSLVLGAVARKAAATG